MMGKVIFEPNNPPSIILYTKEQIIDIKSYLESSSDAIIGVDRTFNVGKCFATTIVYKNDKVLSKNTNEPPLMMGPIYLHWDGKYWTYCNFFSHISMLLDNDNKATMNTELNFQPDIKIRSDDEKALVKALKKCFPHSIHVLCSKHVKDNIRHFMTNKIEMDKTRQNQVIGEIFGPSGIANANTSFEFNNRTAIFEENHSQETMLKEYYKTYLKTRLFEFINKPNRSAEKYGKLWTNNGCESLNNIIKLDINWTPKKLSDLIDSLHNIVKIHHIDFIIRASLHGFGNFYLNLPYRKLLLHNSVWCQKTSASRDDYYINF